MSESPDSPVYFRPILTYTNPRFSIPYARGGLSEPLYVLFFKFKTFLVAPKILPMSENFEVGSRTTLLAIGVLNNWTQTKAQKNLLLNTHS